MRSFLLVFLSVLFLPLTSLRAEECFELRTYHAAPGKLDALHRRFRDHTVALFEKHGIRNVAYWVPRENDAQILIYLLAYESREARETSWKNFLADPEWQAAKAASEKDGKLVAKVESLFLHLTDYSPEVPESLNRGSHFFEMRRYTTQPDKLAALDARFRDHTLSLFTKHGMTNLHYFHLDEDQEGAATTLLYFLAHDSEAARDASFKAFADDPNWKAVREASEEAGPLLVKKGVSSTYLEATDYSPLK